MRTRKVQSALLLTAMLFLSVLGCQGASEPATEPVNAAPASAALSTDEQVLLTLDCYEPTYQMDSQGRVVKLRLEWRHLPNSVLAELNKLSELRNLDLYAATVTDEGLAQLKDLQKLRSIGLGGTLITDEGLPHLEKMRGLQYVWLPGNRLSEDEVEKLKAARPDLNVYLQ